MDANLNAILAMLNDDLVSHGFLQQFIEQTDSQDTSSGVRMQNMLSQLLASGQVEVGTTKLRTPDYVEFIAWQGTVDERVRRAFAAVDNAVSQDKEFAYWICLRGNVDCFEGNESV